MKTYRIIKGNRDYLNQMLQAYSVISGLKGAASAMARMKPMPYWNLPRNLIAAPGARKPFRQTIIEKTGIIDPQPLVSTTGKIVNTVTDLMIADAAVNAIDRTFIGDLSELVKVPAKYTTMKIPVVGKALKKANNAVAGAISKATKHILPGISRVAKRLKF